MFEAFVQSDVEESLRRSGEDLKRLLSRIVEEAALVVALEAKKTAPKRTGFLADSIGYRTHQTSAEVAATAPYASYVEHGTRPHMIYPSRSNVLAFESRGETIFSKYVKHPGSQPKPFMKQAAETAEPKLRSILQSLTEEALK